MGDPVKAVFEAGFKNVPAVSGTVEASVLEVVKDAEEESNHIIRTDHDWIVRVHWTMDGALASCICGRWCLQLFLESYGHGPEFHYPEEDPIYVPLDPCQERDDGEPFRYWQDIRIPAHKIQDKHCGIPYKPVVGLTYQDYCERPGPMAGFVELPTIHFYRVEKPGQVHPPQPTP